MIRRRDGQTGDDGQTRELATQSTWALVSELLVFVGMALSFIVLPTRLSEADYGILGSVQGLVLPAMQVGLLGAPTLLIRRITQGGAVPVAWDRLVNVTLYGSVVVIAALVLGKPWLLGPADLPTYLLLLVANGFLSSAGDHLFLVHMSMRRMDKAALMRLAYVVPRSLALGALFLSDEPDIATWAVIFTGASAVGFALCLIHARLDLGLRYRPGRAGVVFEDCRQSYGYALTGISDGVLSASDRPILVNSGFSVDAGSYTLANRFVAMAMMPSLAFMRVTTPRLFAEGRDGIRGPVRVAVKMTGPTAAIGVVLGLGLLLGAPLARILVGDRYVEVVTMIRWLAVVPLVKSLQYLAGNALDAAAHQRWRFRLTLMAAGLNLGLNLVFIPRYSWKAAIGSTIVSEALLMVALWVAAVLLARREGGDRADLADPGPLDRPGVGG